MPYTLATTSLIINHESIFFVTLFKMNMVAVTSDVMAWQWTLVFVVQVLLEVGLIMQNIAKL